MKPKKNPKIDTRKNSGLYFVIGLSVVLLLVYISLEWKTYVQPEDYDTSLILEEDLEEEVYVLKKLLPPPPEIKVTPDIIDVIDDEEIIEETVIESTESDIESVIINPDEIDYVPPVIDEVIPFEVIEEVPIFPGCENSADQRECFNKMIQKHILKNFRYPVPAQEMGIQGRVTVMFTIKKDGSIEDIRYRGPAEILEKEALRIIQELPTMIPGRQRGTPVDVPFSIPIYFKLQ